MAGRYYCLQLEFKGSIVGPSLFNLFCNDFLLFVVTASVHNFADDNSSSNIAKAIDSLK